MEVQPRRVLITGAKGLLGSSVTRRFMQEPGVAVDAVDLPEVDITDAGQIAGRLDSFRPDLVLHCAAYTAVDACEEDEERACRVNGVGAGIVAKAAAGHDARMIHLSTDYVFDGTSEVPYREDDPTGPQDRLSAYGRSKLLGERQVLEHHPGAVIVRTAWMYGSDGPGFPDAILRRAREGRELRVVDDQRGSPTYAPDLAEALFELSRLKTEGVVHITNSGHCTWCEFACEILRLSGMEVAIKPVTTAEFPRPAKRPAYSVLDNSLYASLGGRPLRSWSDAVGEYISGR